MSRSLESYVSVYQAHLTAINYAPQTVQYKVTALGWFMAWCHERGIDQIEAITRPVLQRYQRHLSTAIERGNKPLSISSQRNRLAAVRTWFTFLMRENYLLYNPASELVLPKPEKRLPQHPLTVAEAEQILIQPDLNTDSGIRDRAILEVLYSTGIRRQELTNLTLRDVNEEAGVLSVRQGKGKKDRFVPIGDRALDWVDTYVQQVRSHYALPRSPDTVFLHRSGEKITCHQLSRWVKKYVDKAEVNKVGSCHLFRHTMATLMLENGADIRFIQQILGHAALSTTEIYTHVAIHQLKAIHQRTHPAKRNDQKAENTAEPDREDLLLALEREADEENVH